MPAGKLHEYALDAEKNLEKLATGLSQEGAPKEMIDAVEQIADALHDVAKALAPPEPEKRPTMDDATNEMMADRRAAQNPEQ